MTRRRYAVGLVALVLVSLGGWRLVVRPLRMLREVGVGVPLLQPDWSCVRSHWEVGCHLSPLFPPRASMSDVHFGTAMLDGQRLGFTLIERTWVVADSQLAGVRDSVGRAMSRRHARPHMCPAYDEMQQRFDELASARPWPHPFGRAWRLGDQDVQMSAAPFRDGRTGQSAWSITVIGFADGVPLCRPPRRRLLTLDEMLGAIHRQLAEQIGF